MSYDVIVVGARLAGSATGMLLARKGLRVLVIDRATFPSDTLSSHQLQTPGVARLRRWGLLDRLHAAGTPMTHRIRFSAGDVVIDGAFPQVDGADAMCSPRRTVLDTILVKAAREAGAEVRERTIVDELVMSDGRVTGVRCHEKGAPSSTATARVVVGADGKNSLVAKAVGARQYRNRGARSVACYAYWQDVPLDQARICSLDRRAIGAFPTSDGQVVTYVAWPVSELAEFRADVDRSVAETLDLTGDLGERIRAGSRVGPVRATTDVPNVIRQPFGPGCALAGDAGLVMDPITGQGMGHALRDAELLSDALAAGLGGSARLDRAMRRYARIRDAQTKPMYDFTVRLASFEPPGPERLLFAAIAERPEWVTQFFGTFTGSVPMTEFFSPRNLIDLVGVRGFAKLARAQRRAPLPRPAPQTRVAASAAQ